MITRVAPMPKIAPAPPIDFAGPQGGALAIAFAAGCIFTASLLAALGTLLWRMFGDGRIKQLEKQIEEERARCDLEISHLREEILQLRTILLVNGPPSIRNAVQASISETRVATSQMEKPQ